MPRLKPGTIIPTPKEATAINAGIAADPDTYELSDEEFAQLRPVPSQAWRRHHRRGLRGVGVAGTADHAKIV